MCCCEIVGACYICSEYKSNVYGKIFVVNNRIVTLFSGVVAGDRSQRRK